MTTNIEQIKALAPNQIADAAHERFVEIYNSKFGEGGEVFFEEQKALFNEEIESGSYAASLAAADRSSLFFAFIFLAIHGLSLERGLTTTCYLECKKKAVGKDASGRKMYAQYAVITITGYGEILLRQRAGQIRSVDSPKLVYDCDSFRVGEDRNGSYVICERCIPRPAGSKIIACYVRIVKPNGETDYFVLDRDEIIRLKNYSAKSNAKWDDRAHGYINGPANALYGTQPDCSDIDTGFLKSKTVKHAFKGYPKLPIGIGGAMEADKDEDVPEPDVQEIQGMEQKNNDNGVSINMADGPF